MATFTPAVDGFDFKGGQKIAGKVPVAGMLQMGTYASDGEPISGLDADAGAVTFGLCGHIEDTTTVDAIRIVGGKAKAFKSGSEISNAADLSGIPAVECWLLVSKSTP